MTSTPNLPLVSIMMPARNAAKYLVATIESIQKQTYPHWELIFVDDGSTDDTLTVIQRFALLDTRIRVHPMPFGGRGRARNTCLTHVRGKYLAVCDADDISFPNRFEKQVAFLEAHPNIGVVGSAWIPFAKEFPTETKPVRAFPSASLEIQKAFKRGKMRVHNATVMLRSDLLNDFGTYNVELRRAQDYEFFSRMSLHGVLFASMPEPLLYYRQEADIPSIAYFRENGMFMAYADTILNGRTQPFNEFATSLTGKFWHSYYTVKYLYFHLKLTFQNSVGR